MKKFVWLFVVILVAVGILAGCSGSDSVATTGVTKEITVDATNYKFEPATIEANKGDKVKLTLKNKEGIHGIKIADFDVDVKKDGETVEFVADQAGTFDFVCSLFCGEGHLEMKGKLVVK